MIEALLALQSVLLLGLYRTLNRTIGRIIALLYVFYMGAFTFLKPILLYYYDLYFPYSGNDPEAVTKLLTCSAIFLFVQYAGLKLMARGPLKAFGGSIFDFQGTSGRAVWLTVALLMAISFIGTAAKYHDPTYLLSFADSFEATNNLAGGGWYINYLSDLAFFAFLVLTGHYCFRMTLAKSLILLLVVLAFTFFWSRPAARTPALVALIAWLCTYFSKEQQARIRLPYLIAFGYILLVLLYVVNFLRSGNADGIDLSTAAFGSLFAAASDLSPVDSAVLIYRDFTPHDYMWFYYLAGALTPAVLIPSSIFPWKIPADKDGQLTQHFFPEGLDTTFFHEGGTATFTVPASGYADAGYFGVFVASVIYLLIFYWYVSVYRRGTPSSRFISCYFLVVHLVGFRLSVESVLISFYTALLLMGFSNTVAHLFTGRRVRTSIGAVRPHAPSTVSPLRR